MELGLVDKVVLVTGGSDGLGLALAQELVQEGARVAVCGRDAERLAAAVTTLLDDGGDAIGVAADVTRPSDLDRFVDAALERWGRIDGVVNNAGRASAMALVDSTDEDWEADLQLKLFAAVRLIRRTIPHLRATRGSIVNVLAVAAKQPAARSGPTSVSRAAGMALTKALSKELGPEGIRVNAVLIGFVGVRAVGAHGRAVGPVRSRTSTPAWWPTPGSPSAGWDGPRSSPTWRPTCSRTGPPTSPGRRSTSTGDSRAPSEPRVDGQRVPARSRTTTPMTQ